MASGSSPERYEAILRRLEEAERPALPAPPRLRVLLLLAAVTAFRWLTVFLLPLVCLAIVGVPAFIRLATGERAPPFVGELCWIVAAGIAVAWWRAFLRRLPDEDPGIALERNREPRLFELADRVALATGAPRADEIRIGPWSSFAVCEEGGGLFRGKRRHVLYLEQCDLEGLDLAELTSILLHEFAHFSEGHTRQGLTLSRRTRFLWALRRELEESRWRFVNPVYLELRLFTAIFDRLYASISRRQELQSDAMAIHLLGPRAFAASLGKSIRSAERTSLRLPRYLDAAVMDGARDRNVLRQAAEHPESEEEAELVQERCDALFTAPTATKDSHPSTAERIEQADRLSRQSPEPAELEALRGGSRAYDVLFDRGWPPLEAAVSTALIARRLGFLHGAIGLRGDGCVSPGELHLPAVTVRRFHSVPVLIWAVAFLGGLLLFGLALLAALVVPEEFSDTTRAILVGIESLFAAGFLLTLRARGVRLTSGDSGLVYDGLLGRQRLRWEDVEALRWNRKRLQVRGLLGGQAVSFTVRGDRRDRDRLADVILELSPRLAFVAWGTGLARVERPQSGAVELPDKVWEEDDELHLAGPGATRISIGDSHPSHGVIREALQRRLLPAMLPQA